MTTPGHTVSIAATGYGLNELTVHVGATVSFLNVDDEPREVALTPATGSTCENIPLVVRPGTSRSCTFTDAGTYVARDPRSADERLRATINVAQEDALLSGVTLSPNRARVVERSVVTLQGSINLARAGVQIDIVAKTAPTGQYKKVGQTSTSAAGAFTYAARPTRTTVYLANAILSTTVVASTFQTVEVVPRTP